MIELDLAITDLEKRGYYLVRRITHGKCLIELKIREIIKNHREKFGRLWRKLCSDIR